MLSLTTMRRLFHNPPMCTLGIVKSHLIKESLSNIINIKICLLVWATKLTLILSLLALYFIKEINHRCLLVATIFENIAMDLIKQAN